MTFSIVAYNADEAAWGVAVASKFLAAAAVVSWAQAGAGAVATQANAAVRFGPRGLDALAHHRSAGSVLAWLLSDDEDAAQRQAGIVDAHGQAAAYTGADCLPWTGHHIGAGFTCQGNILAGPQVLEAMAVAYTSASGELADRLYAALAAGDEAGGDRRGRQAAGLLVVKAGAGYGGDNDRYLDLRVDDDPQPIEKLGRLLRAHHVFFGPALPEDRRPIDVALARELRAYSLRAGITQRPPGDQWDAEARAAFNRLISVENLEERWPAGDETTIDAVALAYLRERFTAP